MRHPGDRVGVRVAELHPRDLLGVREHRAHVLALVVAHEDDGVRALAKPAHDLGRLGAAVDQVADGDDDVVGRDGGVVEQVEQLGVTAVDVADDEGAGHGCR